VKALGGFFVVCFLIQPKGAALASAPISLALNMDSLNSEIVIVKIALFKIAIFLSMTLICGVSWGQNCTELPAEKTVSDQKGGCLALVPVGTPVVASKTLIVMLHGDGEGQLGQRQIDRWTAIGRSLLASDRNVFFMIRPGYQTPVGNSIGWANPKDDDYTAANIARVAGALASLKSTFRAEKVVLVGHSGGAATSALVLGKHPTVADAALLLGCPCDVPPWRDHRNAQRGRGGPWANSLNPLDYTATIPPGTPVIAVTGTQDDNTLPMFAKRWVEKAFSAGVLARYADAVGYNHSSIQQWPDIHLSVTELLNSL
jgi:pimeloyl-ACP methyl ester carboxylesterase